MATATCPNPDCKATLGQSKVQLVSVSVLPGGPIVFAVACRACGTALGVVADKS